MTKNETTRQLPLSGKAIITLARGKEREKTKEEGVEWRILGITRRGARHVTRAVAAIKLRKKAPTSILRRAEEGGGTTREGF